METQTKRVTFTDFAGTLMVFPIWLMPSFIAVAYLYPHVSWVKFFFFALLVFVGQNFQHHFHRLMGRSTFKALNAQKEKQFVMFFILCAFSLLLGIGLIDVFSFLLSSACLLVSFAYTLVQPFKEYVWGVSGFTCEFAAAYRFLSLSFPSFGSLLLHTGITLLVGSWLVGYRVMTGDYGAVPLSSKNVMQHMLALTIAVPILALGILWR
jgi:hypothetical protein